MARIAYVLKAFGRTSETFISNEIRLVEQLGVPLRIFSLKTLTGQQRHASVQAIESPIEWLPETAELNQMRFVWWLAKHIPLFAIAHARVAARRPVSYLAAVAETVWMSIAYRESLWSGPRKVFIKEFLQAGYIADAILQDSETEHLHGHFCHGVTTVTMLAARMCGRSFSFTAHAKDIYVPELNPGDLLRRKMERAAFVVTCTQANKQHLDTLHARGADHVRAIYHGLNTSLFAPSEGHAAPTPRILSVGRFVEKKGFTYLVEACHILRSLGYEFECFIVGGADSYKAQVEQRIAELDLQHHVRLMSSVTQEQLRDIYAESTVFALPCQVLDNGDRDGIPNVLAEAMAMELPVVSTAISGIPEVVHHGENGLLVEPRNAEALAMALARILQDPSRASAMGAAARRTILNVFDSTANTRRLATLFRQRLSGMAAEARKAEPRRC